jgi:hypothetical protein
MKEQNNKSDIHQVEPETSGEKSMWDGGERLDGQEVGAPADGERSRDVDAAQKTLREPAEDAQESHEARLSELAELYRDELHEAMAELGSEYDEVEVPPLAPSTWEPRTPAENKQARTEYSRRRPALMRAWEEKHGESWPRYENDTPGPPPKRAGQPYDCHHIQPLGAGGRNTVENVIPLHRDRHQVGSPQGVHRTGSPLTRLVKTLKEG